MVEIIKEKNSRTYKIGVCITSELKNEILKRAKKEERSVSAIAYRLIRKALESEKSE